jgi:hypothetical protein
MEVRLGRPGRAGCARWVRTESLGRGRTGAPRRCAGWVGTAPWAPLEFTPRRSPCTAVYKFQARPWPPPRFPLPPLISPICGPDAKPGAGKALGLPAPGLLSLGLPACPPSLSLSVVPLPPSWPAQTCGPSLLTRVQPQPPPPSPGTNREESGFPTPFCHPACPGATECQESQEGP